MRALVHLMLALAASLALYGAVFSFVHRPLTLGDIPRLLQRKLEYAAGLPSPRLLVFAGSNGLYSHRCEALGQAIRLPCVNMSFTVGIGLDFLLDHVLRMLRPGDVLYMPLEYSQYGVSREEMNAGLHNPVLVHDLPNELWAMDCARIMRAYGFFDLPFLVHGVVEMTLARTGFQRRTNLGSLTPQGDESGHTAQGGAPYRGFLRGARFGSTEIPSTSHARDVLARFLAQALERGVVVVGGLPTIPDDVPLSPATIDAVRAVFEQHRFVVLPNHSQYPLSCFFDTLYHLNEECQLEHSRSVGAALAAALPRNP